VQDTKLKVMVLLGGPDRERAVSLESGARVARGLREAGHKVLERDIGPEDLSALDQWARWRGDVVFPVLHGPWGEGGPLQRELDQRDIPYVGCKAEAAGLCIDKHRTKLVLVQHGLPTPEFEVVVAGHQPHLAPPVVVKAPFEGSSIDLAVCRTAGQLRDSLERLRKHPVLLVERFIGGKEFAVGVRDSGSGMETLPAIYIVPAGNFFDYASKYNRDDTQYVLDPLEMGLADPAGTVAELSRLALEASGVLGCRHMSRVDFIVDHQGRPWILEVNTIPGFTEHSLLPMAAARVGLPMPVLVDRLARLVVRE